MPQDASAHWPDYAYFITVRAEPAGVEASPVGQPPTLPERPFFNPRAQRSFETSFWSRHHVSQNFDLFTEFGATRVAFLEHKLRQGKACFSHKTACRTVPA